MSPFYNALINVTLLSPAASSSWGSSNSLVSKLNKIGGKLVKLPGVLKIWYFNSQNIIRLSFYVLISSSCEQTISFSQLSIVISEVCIGYLRNIDIILTPSYQFINKVKQAQVQSQAYAFNILTKPSPLGYFYQVTCQCYSCSPDCLLCTNNLQCLCKKTGNFLKIVEYSDPICTTCSNGCLLCQNQLYCIKCKNSFKLRQLKCQCPVQSFYLQENQCVQCKTSCLLCDNKNSCTCSKIGQFLNSKLQCSNCKTQCLTCISQTACVECLRPNVVLQEGVCYNKVQNCKIQQKNDCKECQQNFGKTSSSRCSICPSPGILDQQFNKCRCPKHYSFNGSNCQAQAVGLGSQQIKLFILKLEQTKTTVSYSYSMLGIMAVSFFKNLLASLFQSVFLLKVHFYIATFVPPRIYFFMGLLADFQKNIMVESVQTRYVNFTLKWIQSCRLNSKAIRLVDKFQDKKGFIPNIFFIFFSLTLVSLIWCVAKAVNSICKDQIIDFKLLINVTRAFTIYSVELWLFCFWQFNCSQFSNLKHMQVFFSTLFSSISLINIKEEYQEFKENHSKRKQSIIFVFITRKLRCIVIPFSVLLIQTTFIALLVPLLLHFFILIFTFISQINNWSKCLIISNGVGFMLIQIYFMKNSLANYEVIAFAGIALILITDISIFIRQLVRSLKVLIEIIKKKYFKGKPKIGSLNSLRTTVVVRKVLEPSLIFI